VQTKAAILVGFVTLLAFVWGYTKDSLSFDLSALWNSVPAMTPAAETAPDVQEALTERQVAQGDSGSARAGTASSLMPSSGVAAQNSSQYPNPYANMGMNPFAGNIEAIQGERPAEGGVQRNAYFDKLSQQMRELQQQTSMNSVAIPGPPPPPGFPTPNAGQAIQMAIPQAPNPEGLIQPDASPPPEFSEDVGDAMIDTDPPEDDEGEELSEEESGVVPNDLVIQ